MAQVRTQVGPDEVPGEGPGEVPGEGLDEVPVEGPGEAPGEGLEEVPGEVPGEGPGVNTYKSLNRNVLLELSKTLTLYHTMISLILQPCSRSRLDTKNTIPYLRLSIFHAEPLSLTNALHVAN